MSRIFKCAFCKGTGTNSFHLSSVNTDCPVCGGTGKSNVEGLKVTCVYCSGTGKNEHNRMLCAVCCEREIVTMQAIQNIHNAMFLKNQEMVSCAQIMAAED